MLPTNVLLNKSPYESMKGKAPTYLDLNVFGSLCFASSLEGNITKFDLRARKCIFLGYKNGIKGYVLFDTKTKEILISRNMILYENVFPYKHPNINYDFENIRQNKFDSLSHVIYYGNYYSRITSNGNKHDLITESRKESKIQNEDEEEEEDENGRQSEHNNSEEGYANQEDNEVKHSI